MQCPYEASLCSSTDNASSSRGHAGAVSAKSVRRRAWAMNVRTVPMVRKGDESGCNFGGACRNYRSSLTSAFPAPDAGARQSADGPKTFVASKPNELRVFGKPVVACSYRVRKPPLSSLCIPTDVVRKTARLWEDYHGLNERAERPMRL